MDVYHKVLIKLYQVTGGKDSQAIDLKDLVKSLGFLGSYNEISQMLSGEGWIAETPKLNFVRITHWGVNEVNKSGSSEPDAAQIVRKAATNLIAETKQFVTLLEEFASDTSTDNFEQMEKKLNEINTAVGKLRENIK